MTTFTEGKNIEQRSARGRKDGEKIGKVRMVASIPPHSNLTGESGRDGRDAVNLGT